LETGRIGGNAVDDCRNIAKFRAMKPFLGLLTAVFALALNLRAAEALVPDISHAELKKAVQEKTVTLIDVNGTDSWRKGHIPGAIDFDAQEKKLADLLPKDKSALVVAYCLDERCPAYKLGARAALALGYTNVKHYPLGIDGWKKQESVEAAPKKR
jgi:rhodanese-related sulfurtransferase